MSYYQVLAFLISSLTTVFREFLGNIEIQQSKTDQNLGQHISQLATSLRSCHLSTSDHLIAELDRATKRIDAEHALTRQHAEQHIKAAVQDLKISQNEHHINTEQYQHSKKVYQQFLGSLAYDEINLRKNEISSSHPETFQWIFDEHIQHSWDCFAKWLKSDNHLYWINGKAGSGKSTLMKFLANHDKTKSFLAQWSAPTEVLIVTYYFWLSGSILQRSSKGFLCSVIYQMLSGDDKLFEKSITASKEYLDKRVIHDWAKSELQGYLKSLLILTSRQICFFIDGLDEFDQEEDIDYLLSLVSKFAAHIDIKICTSSRPEPFIVKRMSGNQQLRLQDLTANDMEICIRSELQRLHSQDFPFIPRKSDLIEIIRAITGKADGVFLWVFYTLRSLTKGLRNDDDFHELLHRVEELPSEMHQLYLQMWKRLNGDEKRYQIEAATYFSYESFYPLTLFELVVALDPALQDKYLDECKSQDPLAIADRCARLQTRILTRCAGLLEVNIQPHCDIDSESDAQVYGNMDQGILRLYKAQIEFLHRTARDFLLGTKEGQALFSKSKETHENLERNMLNALLASAIQGGLVDNSLFVFRFFDTVYRLAFEIDISTVIIARKVCESLIQSGKLPIYERLVGLNCYDFEGCAASCGLPQYLRHFVMSFYSQISPYYLGHLVFCVLDSSKPRSDLHLVAWLVGKGADLGTRHLVRKRWQKPGLFCALSPALELCFAIMRNYAKEYRGKLHHSSCSDERAQILRQLTPSLLLLETPCLIPFTYENPWLPHHPLIEMLYSRQQYHWNQSVFWVEMSIAKLWIYILRLIEKRTTVPTEWEHILKR